MDGSSQHVSVDAGRYDRLWWLPAHGLGNGIDDRAWVAVVDVRGEQVALSLLALFLDAGIPAYAATLSRAGVMRLGRRSRGWEPRPAPWRLWVGASARGAGENLLLRVLPEITRTYGDTALA